MSLGALVALPFPKADAVNVRLAVPRDIPLTVKNAMSWFALLLSPTSTLCLGSKKSLIDPPLSVTSLECRACLLVINFQVLT